MLVVKIINIDFLFSQSFLQSFLKPTIRYELKHGDMLTFGDVKCQYLVELDTNEVGKQVWFNRPYHRKRNALSNGCKTCLKSRV